MQETVQRRLTERKKEFEAAVGQLHALSPLGVLARGYAVVSDGKGRVLKSAGEISPGEMVHIRLQEGGLTAQVIEGQVEPHGKMEV